MHPKPFQNGMVNLTLPRQPKLQHLCTLLKGPRKAGSDHDENEKVINEINDYAPHEFSHMSPGAFVVEDF